MMLSLGKKLNAEKSSQNNETLKMPWTEYNRGCVYFNLRQIRKTIIYQNHDHWYLLLYLSIIFDLINTLICSYLKKIIDKYSLHCCPSSPAGNQSVTVQMIASPRDSKRPIKSKPAVTWIVLTNQSW